MWQDSRGKREEKRLSRGLMWPNDLRVTCFSQPKAGAESSLHTWTIVESGAFLCLRDKDHVVFSVMHGEPYSYPQIQVLKHPIIALKNESKCQKLNVMVSNITIKSSNLQAKLLRWVKKPVPFSLRWCCLLSPFSKTVRVQDLKASCLFSSVLLPYSWQRPTQKHFKTLWLFLGTLLFLLWSFFLLWPIVQSFKFCYLQPPLKPWLPV